MRCPASCTWCGYLTDSCRLDELRLCLHIHTASSGTASHQVPGATVVGASAKAFSSCMSCARTLTSARLARSATRNQVCRGLSPSAHRLLVVLWKSIFDRLLCTRREGSTQAHSCSISPGRCAPLLRTTTQDYEQHPGAQAKLHTGRISRTTGPMRSKSTATDRKASRSCDGLLLVSLSIAIRDTVKAQPSQVCLMAHPKTAVAEPDRSGTPVTAAKRQQEHTHTCSRPVFLYLNGHGAVASGPLGPPHFTASAACMWHCHLWLFNMLPVRDYLTDI